MTEKVFAFLSILIPFFALANLSSPAWDRINSEVSIFQYKMSQFRSSSDSITIDMILGEGSISEQQAALRKEIEEIRVSDRGEGMKAALIKVRQEKLDRLSGRSNSAVDHQTIQKIKVIRGQEPRLSSVISSSEFYNFLVEWMSYEEKDAAFKRKTQEILKIEKAFIYSTSSEATSERVLNILSSASLIVRQNPDLMPALEAFAKEILTQEISRAIIDHHSDSRYFGSLPLKVRNFVIEGRPIGIQKKVGNTLIELNPGTSFMNKFSCKNLFSS